jgi:hypothetical protein
MPAVRGVGREDASIPTRKDRETTNGTVLARTSFENRNRVSPLQRGKAKDRVHSASSWKKIGKEERNPRTKEQEDAFAVKGGE